ncbi:hypothetical protein HaLaN_23586 [Haematococcus lacustris]|uniref:Uncharacterized protein n=1 Tax=Haematococcus lacustris TaxID=44745 RepID=A0A6A0A2B2_HAELA|nr:hypothetical protein HaLaN_23586 [Haematococcus lacustris]
MRIPQQVHIAAPLAAPLSATNVQKGPGPKGACMQPSKAAHCQWLCGATAKQQLCQHRHPRLLLAPSGNPSFMP